MLLDEGSDEPKNLGAPGLAGDDIANREPDMADACHFLGGSYAAIAAESIPERQVEMIAASIAATMERLAPVWVAYREAAAVDAKAAGGLIAGHRRRHETFAGMIAMIPEQRLRRSCSSS